ncbi:MAG: caspase-like protein [Hyphomicrobiales bacterium]|nr:caspase-like protein [Hyphomicrobiales bacterium]
MANLVRTLAAALFMLASFSWAHAQAPEPRIALVIGNSAYRAGSLVTPSNDAGLVAQTLTQAGFDVIGARDLDQDGLRRSFRDFIEKAAASGPDTIAFVYLAGYGLQYAGENFFVPVEATLTRDSSVPIEAVRVSDLTRALADLPLKARFFVLDVARPNPFAPTGQPLAGGLALVETERGSLTAFNAAPGTIPPEPTGEYGPYAKALAEMMQEGGVNADEIFARTRLRVSETTRGAQVPWHVSRLSQPITFFERAVDAPPPRVGEAPSSRLIRELPVADAYGLALERDTIAAYQEFLTAYPRDPLSPRVEAMLAARREALTWRRAVARNTPPAYWSYIRRYPHGPHLSDAHRRLAILSAAFEPPAVFDEYDFDVPPPPPEEYEYVSGPVMFFDETYYAPPPPIYFLPPPPRAYIDLAPPRLLSPGFLPVPIPVYLPTARPWRNDVNRQPVPVRLPGGVTPRDVGTPQRFIAPTPTRFNQQRVQPGLQTPFIAPQQNGIVTSPQQIQQQQIRQQQNQQQDIQRQQQQRDLQLRTQQQQFRQQREQQLRTQQLQQVQQQRDQQLRGHQQRVQQQQQLQQQRVLQQRDQRVVQQRDQQVRAQQYQRQREQQLRAQQGQQLQQQRAQQYQQQMRSQQQQQQRVQQQQQQIQMQRAQQQQQQMQRAQQQQQQMQRAQQQQQQMQRAQQQQQQQMQRAQQQQQQQQQRVQQQHRQQPQQQPQRRTDCGVPGKPPCR